MACNAAGGEHWRFFEIDPVVVGIARNEFSYLRSCMPDADIVLGDARLTIARETPAAFDYLLIDAFSSDSIPVHLLTREALSLYLDKLAPDGILALHISNRNLELGSVVAAIADSIAGVHGVIVYDAMKSGIDASPSIVVLLSRSDTALAPALAWPGAALARANGTAVWTDDYSNVLAALVRNYWR